MRQAGATDREIERAIAAFDSQGLLHAEREIKEPFKREFALSKDSLEHYGLAQSPNADPVEMIRAFKPTILVGATGQPGSSPKR